MATVKHTHHHHELDAPGKDSHKHREAGAAAVGILSPQMTALFIPADREQQGESRYANFEALFSGCDLILVEGDLHASAPRIEVWRHTATESPYAANDSEILAVVSDEIPQGLKCPVWSRHDIAKIADNIVSVQGLNP